MSETTNRQYDIAIIGSGIACALTLSNTLGLLEAGKTRKKKLTIAVIEKTGEFWKGIAYGKRTNINSLIISTLRDFVHEKNKEPFIDWLKMNKDKWLCDLKKEGGQVAETWISRNMERMNKNEWEEIFLPRSLFGKFLVEQLEPAIESATAKGLVEIDRITGEAIDITALPGISYEITLSGNAHGEHKITAAKTVIAIGSPPVKSLQKEIHAPENSYTYINDIYTPGEDNVLAQLRSSLEAVKDPAERNMLVVGSNASSLEILYLVQHNPELKNLINRIVILSHTGQFPYPIRNKPQEFNFDALDALRSSERITSLELIAAIEKDLKNARKLGINIADIAPESSYLVVELLKKLTEEHRKDFFWHHGMRFTKMIRRAGLEYRNVPEILSEENKLQVLRGSFLNLEKAKPGQGVVLNYLDPVEKKSVTYPLGFPVVINCGGFEDLHVSTIPVINSLVKHKLANINITGRGFEVNENFEAHPNLYIIGPLLGGNFNSLIHFWHVESAPRIFGLAEPLAEILVK